VIAAASVCSTLRASDRSVVVGICAIKKRG